MPASPITVKLDGYPSRWIWKQQIILADKPTGHFYRIHYHELDYYLDGKNYEKGKWRAELHCCNLADNPSVEEHWYQVEELCLEHSNILNTIKMLFDVTIAPALQTYE
tara:strand:+ start:359 stop:682 length:324 start_codon:yes stop_codon:yes gene_type:complete